jgi:hypothetical protein
MQGDTQDGEQKRRYVILLAKGRESEPLTMTELYAHVRERRLAHDGMVFDLETRGWTRASEYPTLRVIFKQLKAEADKRPHPNSMPPLAAPAPKPSLAQRLAGLFGRPGGAL